MMPLRFRNLAHAIGEAERIHEIRKAVSSFQVVVVHVAPRWDRSPHFLDFEVRKCSRRPRGWDAGILTGTSH